MSISSSRFELALEQLKPSDWERFESLCSAFLSTEFSGLRTMASPGGDRGRDAELYNFSDEPNVLFQYSVTENWKPKIQKMACCRFHGHRVKVFLLKPESMNAKTNIQPRVQA
ncbi:hypothetical protein [Rhizobium sp. IY2]|uniref:hypothetical protein n=1 Tax=Rhizobium sp. IY2 TaxID=3397853 RepID=UPI0039E1F192